MFIPKYINNTTGEVCCNLKQVLHSAITDLKHFKFKALTWIFKWELYKPSKWS